MCRLFIFFTIICLIFWCSNAKTITSKSGNASTTVITKNTNQVPEVDVKVLGTPHHLFIGRCYPFYPVLHQEKIVLTNDGKSHVSGVIRINIEGEAYITCVNVYDETTEGANGYPSFIEGGIGKNYVTFGVVTAYGKGFEFYVQIFGYSNIEDFKKYSRL